MRRGRPLVKICGVTRVEDALAAARLGADSLGLNFAPRSPRRVDPAAGHELALEIRARFPRVRLVGVFVDAPAAAVRRTIEELGLDLAQLHGDESDEDHRALGGRAVRVFRGVPRQERIEAVPAAPLYLVDGAGDGGSGASWPYEELAARRFPGPVLVAGGIRPGNAARALAASGADGIDVASGVESAPGIKDPEKMAALMEEITRVEEG